MITPLTSLLLDRTVGMLKQTAAAAHGSEFVWIKGEVIDRPQFPWVKFTRGEFLQVFAQPVRMQ